MFKGEGKKLKLPGREKVKNKISDSLLTLREKIIKISRKLLNRGA